MFVRECLGCRPALCIISTVKLNMNDIEDSMKTIEVDDDIYRHIASHTEQIGESASDILRRLLSIPGVQDPQQAPKTDRLTTLPIEQLLAEGALKKETKAIARFMLTLRTLYPL